MNDLKDILNNNPDIDPKLLQQYFEGKLDDATKHQVEAALAGEDPFLSDAADGLQQHSGNLSLTLYEIEKKINKRIREKTKQKVRKPLLSISQVVLAVALLLLLIVAGYGIIRLLLQK